MSNTRIGSGMAMPVAGSGPLSTLAENWWLLLLRGLAAIAFGVIAFFWPGVTLVALTYLWGVYAVVDGVIAIWAAFNTSGADAGPPLVARAERRCRHSRGARGIRLYGNDCAGTADVHRGMGDHYRCAATLRGD
jgi:hypothetical protein